ncbi:MAG: polysaccharide biosynthesis C-terminal domain-containing protein [Lachnospiraceae bacterium]|nr:polysaccharide biosynthesis C-terminal domain-containing protein [Lachnospiraceae bacterium]
MGKYRYFAGNMALFSISNFVSKLLVFLLVPFYTNVLSTKDYGICDVMQTTLLLLVPALTVNTGEAALRYGIECSEKRSQILKIGIRYTLRASCFVIVSCTLFSFFFPAVRGYFLIFGLLFLANSSYEYLVLFFQGCEQVKIVVSGSIFSTAVLIASNLLLLLVIKMGIYGYILSQIAAFSLACVLMLILSGHYAPYLYEKDGEKGGIGSLRRVIDDPSFEKELLDYGVPLIAYSTGAWINNASDRYMVSAFCGVAVNGIYGVAYKIPAILSVFQRIFAQSFQMSATKSFNDENSEGFFNEMFRFYNAFMVTGSSFLILTVRIFAAFMFKKDFYTAWTFVPPLLISVVFGAMTGFFGSICLANKDSKAMGIATFAGAVINVLLNLILIRRLSAMGAAIATAVSYYIMFIMAYFMVKKYVSFKKAIIKSHISYILLAAEAYIMIKGGTDPYMICGVLFILILAMYLPEAVSIVKKLSETVKQKKWKN